MREFLISICIVSLIFVTTLGIAAVWAPDKAVGSGLAGAIIGIAARLGLHLERLAW